MLFNQELLAPYFIGLQALFKVKRVKVYDSKTLTRQKHPALQLALRHQHLAWLTYLQIRQHPNMRLNTARQRIQVVAALQA